jgi:hypothetical protein
MNDGSATYVMDSRSKLNTLVMSTSNKLAIGSNKSGTNLTISSSVTVLSCSDPNATKKDLRGCRPRCTRSEPPRRQ